MIGLVSKAHFSFPWGVVVLAPDVVVIDGQHGLAALRLDFLVQTVFEDGLDALEAFGLYLQGLLTG